VDVQGGGAVALQRLIKHNPLTSGAYKWWLDRRCRSVEAWVFVANAGRSGSKSLADMFSAIEGCVGLHEPSPKMLRDYPADRDLSEFYDRAFNSRKVVYIKRAAAGHRYYAETTHMFIKTFADPAIRHFGQATRIVHLVRDPVNVASSFYSLGRVPGKDPLARLYLLEPTAPDNLLDVRDWLEPHGPFEHDFYRCLWYWYEIEARCRRLNRRYPTIVFHRIRTEDLNDVTVLGEMFHALGIKVVESVVAKLAGTRSNLRGDLKTQKLDVASAHAMRDAFERRLEERFGGEMWS
jgi:hypothetical protein